MPTSVASVLVEDLERGNRITIFGLLAYVQSLTPVQSDETLVTVNFILDPSIHCFTMSIRLPKTLVIPNVTITT